MKRDEEPIYLLMHGGASLEFQAFVFSLVRIVWMIRWCTRREMILGWLVMGKGKRKKKLKISVSYYVPWVWEGEKKEEYF